VGKNIMNTLYSLEILVNDKPVRHYAHNNRLFIEAKLGTEYQIKIKNNTLNRVLAVPSVDGISPIDGEQAKDNSPGYVIDGLRSFTIVGYRTSNDSVNAFKFSSKTNSYAAKSDALNGDTSNCGVIGIKIFKEVEKVVQVGTNEPILWWGDFGVTTIGGLIDRNYSDKIYSSFLADTATEFSNKKIESHVIETTFDKGKEDAHLEVFYASRQALESLGIKFIPEQKVSFPQSFPKFCKPPNK
jgi:hypothetical protein